MAFLAKTWENTRPTCCKGSGVADACKHWAKNCPAAGDWTQDERKYKAAETTIADMLTALKTAEGKLGKAKDKDKEKVAGTKSLITEWRKDAREYQEQIEKTKTKVSAKDMEKNLAAANKVMDNAVKVTEGYQKQISAVKTNMKAVAEGIKRLVVTAEKGLSLSVGERKALLKKSDELAAKGASYVLTSDKMAVDHRKELADYRQRGGAGVAKDHGLDDKAQAEMSKRFSEHMKQMTEFERDVKTVTVLGEEVNVDSVSIRELSAKTWDIVPGYQKILQAVVDAWGTVNGDLVSTLGKTNPGTVLKKLTDKSPPKAIEDQIQLAQDKMVSLDKIEKRIIPISDKGLERVPRDFRGVPELSELVKQIEGFSSKFESDKAEFVKLANEGIKHGKELLASLGAAK